MPMESLTVGAFMSKFGGYLLGLIAIVFGYGRLNEKVETQKERVDRVEGQLSDSLKEFKSDYKDSMNAVSSQLNEISSTVNDQHKAMADLHIDVLKSQIQAEK